VSPSPRSASTLARLRSRAVPDWYHDAKLGVFVHWTMAAVPGYAPREHEINELLRHRYDEMQVFVPYTEWYENSLRFPHSPVARYHREHYGDRPYADFRAPFERAIARWDPDAWAERFAAAGARYVVLVTKHHDGYCLWPSRVANPKRPGWQSARDCVGELAGAVRARGMRFGVYYSGGLDWTFDTRPIATMGDVLAAMPGGDYPAYAEAQVRELIEDVSPDVLWNDISWPGDRDDFLRLVGDYYRACPEGVINDRWITRSLATRALKWRPLRRLADAALRRAVRRPGANLTPPPSVHFDARTPEYTVFPRIRREKWECVRGMDKSFGFNRASLPDDFISHDDMIHSLVDIVSKNGNLLINVGPRGEDAGIPDPQLERLGWLGAFLERNGEAVFATRPWQRAEGATREGPALRFTARGDTLHAFVLARWRGGPLTLRDVPLPDGGEAALVGGGPLRWERQGPDLRVELPHGLPDAPAHAIALRPARAAAPIPGS